MNSNANENARPPVSIVIPTHGAANRFRTCLASLAKFAPAECSIYVLDEATPDDSIREACEQTGSSLTQLRYFRNEVKRGFASECQVRCESFREPRSDLLLLSAETEVTAGFLEEMQVVLYLHERHAVVSPRSNHAGLFSIPLEGEDFDAADSYAIWKEVSHMLPRYQVMPTAASFCLLVKAEVLDRFCLSDDVDEFVCRINRHGYSAIAANRAYVFHDSRALCGSRQMKAAETRRDLLLYQYPEYERKFAEYERFEREPLERFAVLCRRHRPRILYDLFHLPAAHTGTSNFGLNLLGELSRIVNDEFELFVGMKPTQRYFASELAGFRMYEEDSDSAPVFDLVFKPCQVLSWIEFGRMNRLAPRLSCTVLDIISVRCDYLSSPGRQIALRKTAELSDCVFTLSDFVRADFAAFYGADIPFRVIHLGTSFGMTSGEIRPGEYVLVVGNNFAHKGVSEAIYHIDAKWPVVVLGGEPQPAPANVRWLASGNITRQHVRELFSNARVLVYPSHYEGFGLPIIDALALGKPVVVLDSAVNRELASTLADSNLHRISSMQTLPATVARLFEAEAGGPPGKAPRRWSDVAADYAQAFQELLSRDFDLAKIRARWELLRTLEAREVSSIEPSRATGADGET